jgi:hypothetical protein
MSSQRCSPTLMIRGAPGGDLEISDLVLSKSAADTSPPAPRDDDRLHTVRCLELRECPSQQQGRATQSATFAGSSLRQAPNAPLATPPWS